MGYALAEVLAKHGAHVSLVSGPTPLKTTNPGITVQPVVSAHDMFMATGQAFTHCDIAVFCAAVADFTPAQPSAKKIKRGKEALTIQLEPTVDIAATLGKQKKAGQHIIGFALETNDETANAIKKMSNKNLDMVVLNSLNDQGAGFGTETNKVTFLYPDGRTVNFDLKSKQEVAEDIAEAIEELIRKNQT